MCLESGCKDANAYPMESSTYRSHKRSFEPFPSASLSYSTCSSGTKAC